MDDTAPDLNEFPENLVYALAASPGFGSHPRGACFAAVSTGLLKSSDGLAWENAFASLDVPEGSTVTALAISPEFERDGCILAGVSGGVLRSSDAGKSWKSAVFPPPLPMVSALVISPNFSQDGTLFAGTLEDGVLVSSDGGSQWAAWNFGLLDLNVLQLAISPDFARDETLFAGTETGLFRSTNGSRAWREVTLPAGNLAVTALAVSPDFAADRTLYAGTDGGGLFRSRDGAKTWSRLGEAAGVELVNQILIAPRAKKSPEIWILAGDQLLVSGDHGETWQPRISAQTAADMLCAACLLPGSGLLAGFAGPKLVRI